MAEHTKAQPDVDAISGKTTTGHEWDGIKELNTPLPRWWLNIFYACIIWSFAYYIAYPAWPLISSHTKGLLGYSSRAELEVEMAALRADRERQAAGLTTASLEEIKANPTLLGFALAQGRAAFGDNCAPCHGLGGGGAKGFPNLNDDDWLWGGKLDDIHTTLLNGIRSTNNAQTRVSQMPAFGRMNVLKADEIKATAGYVRSKAGLPVAEGAKLDVGAKVFAEQCASCHGDDGKGNRDLGAPNLTDAIWLYGSEEANIADVITNSRNGVMPAWADRLDPATIKALTLYVHGLGGGQ